MDAPIIVDELAPVRRSLRIAVVTETYPPEVNGVASTLAHTVEGLRARHHALQLIRPRQDKDDAASSADRFHEVLLHGLPIPRYPHLKMGVPSRRALGELWARRRPDIVHIATEGPLGWSALHAALKLKLPITSDFRTNFHAYSQHYGVGWLARPMLAYLRKFHNRTLCTMVPTEALRRELQAQGFQKLTVVARGVDTRGFTPHARSVELRRNWAVADDTPVVLYVGRLAPEKNLQLLLDTFDAMRKVVPTARLLLVGDGPQRKELQARCPDAIFAGVRSGAALAAHYASSDMFAFPSMTETYGNVTVEAMASGLPVLAFAHAAAGLLVEPGLSGRLAPMGDGAAFAEAGAQLIGDRVGRLRMGLQARSTALTLDWGRIVGQIEGVFLQALRAQADSATDAQSAAGAAERAA